MGKLLSALAWVFVLILASIPVTALVFVFGGVAPDDVLRGYASCSRPSSAWARSGHLLLGAHAADRRLDRPDLRRHHRADDRLVLHFWFLSSTARSGARASASSAPRRSSTSTRSSPRSTCLRDGGRWLRRRVQDHVGDPRAAGRSSAAGYQPDESPGSGRRRRTRIPNPSRPSRGRRPRTWPATASTWGAGEATSSAVWRSRGLLPGPVLAQDRHQASWCWPPSSPSRPSSSSPQRAAGVPACRVRAAAIRRRSAPDVPLLAPTEVARRDATARRPDQRPA